MAIGGVCRNPGVSPCQRRGSLGWRQALRRSLPVYMVPAVFVRVETMPPDRKRKGGPEGPGRAFP